MPRRILFATLLLIAAALLPARAHAAHSVVIYEFTGLTAALPPVPGHPDGVPSHVEAFTLTTREFLPVPFAPDFLTLTDFDECTACWAAVGVYVWLIPEDPQSLQLQFNDILNIAYGYTFLPDVFWTVGVHTTADYEAIYGSGGPFASQGTLIVTRTVPAPGTLLLVLVGVAALVQIVRIGTGRR